MSKYSAFAGAVLSLVALAVPGRAQNFQNGSPEPVWRGNLRLTASPVHMWEDGSGTTGGAFRLGYGITDAFDVEAKTAFFDGLVFLGGDAHLNLLSGDTSLTTSVGGHSAIGIGNPDSYALDLAVQMGQRLGRRVAVYAAPSFSYETINGATFTRWYLVPGLKVGVADRVDLLVEGGVGFGDNSPHYLTAGVTLHVPVKATARGPRR